jgi:hypothetical protein
MSVGLQELGYMPLEGQVAVAATPSTASSASPATSSPTASSMMMILPILTAPYFSKLILGWACSPFLAFSHV